MSTIERKCSVANKTRIQNLQDLLQRKVTLVLISLNMLITKRTIKWTVLAILIGETILTESSIVENNKSSTMLRLQEVDLVFYYFLFLFSFYFQFNFLFSIYG